MTVAERLLGQLVTANNDRIWALDGGEPNPRPVDQLAWSRRLVVSIAKIQMEWEEFVSAGLQLPLIEQLIDEHQGNDGEWRAGLLVSRGRPCDPLARLFPLTIEALRSVPRLRSALWSELAPGSVLPDHVGPNAGMLRYHLGVRCGSSAALRIDGEEVPFRDGEAVLFDDTAVHSAWNCGNESRVTLFCELERPLPTRAAIANRAVQFLISRDPRYRGAPKRAARLHRELNAPGAGTGQQRR